ncbi:toxic anion resistance protein [Aneurinibacillus terranovensis]|uniref:toxic anion resistance protein n=1 Tax=Aneurinibacillus terranovensis TaxID=278991 RepID=UPI00041C4820|nr:toxic anion resistance protein [Aneurinibacillus terranovensis]
MNEPMTLIKEEDIQKIHREAETVVQKMSDKNQTEVEKLVLQLGSLGETTQREAGQSLEILKRPVKELMSDKNSEVSNTLLKLRSCVDELNPSKGARGNFVSRLLGKNPIQAYIRKYESVEKQIAAINESLLRGRDQLQEDIVELRQIKNIAIDKIYELEKRTYFGKKLLEMLEAESLTPAYADNKTLIEKAMQKVVTRVKNMTQMVNLLQQSIASIDLIIENNEKLDEAVFNALTMMQNVVTVSASIQVALGHQEKVINAVQKVNEGIEEIMLSNAASLRSNTERTNALLEKPSIAIDKIQTACNDLYAAIQASEESNSRMISSGKNYISIMDKLNQDMRAKLSVGSALPDQTGKLTESLFD